MCTQVLPIYLAESHDDIVHSCQIDLRTHSILDSPFSEISSVNESDVTGAHGYIGGTEMKVTNFKAFDFIIV